MVGNMLNSINICKLSLITDANGIPYNIFVGNGNTNDCKILMQQINTQNVVNIDTSNNFNYFMADSGYAIQKKYGMY